MQHVQTLIKNKWKATPIFKQNLPSKLWKDWNIHCWFDWPVILNNIVKYRWLTKKFPAARHEQGGGPFRRISIPHSKATTHVISLEVWPIRNKIKLQSTNKIVFARRLRACYFWSGWKLPWQSSLVVDDVVVTGDRFVCLSCSYFKGQAKCILEIASLAYFHE